MSDDDLIQRGEVLRRFELLSAFMMGAGYTAFADRMLETARGTLKDIPAVQPASLLGTADLESAVRRALEAAARAAIAVRQRDETTEEEAIGAMVCASDIRHMAADPTTVARIASER